MATIYDVAKAAQVSIAAVSLVMNDPTTPRVGLQKKKTDLRKLREARVLAQRVSPGS
jgi:DNA-binding LacI/PurR family transcriptional regulator